MDSAHILCFGDSLTTGWTSMDREFHPYADSLLSSLRKRFPSADITADVQGQPGDQVVSPPGGFLPRIDISYEETETPYTWAIILGGTNDLIMRRNADEIWDGLKKVYEIALENNTRVLALTVPECGDCSSFADEQRDRLNGYIRAHESQDVDIFDLHAAIPFHGMPRSRRKAIWFDSTHFTEEGYDLLGSLLAERIYELVSGSAGKPAQNLLKSDPSERLDSSY